MGFRMLLYCFGGGFALLILFVVYMLCFSSGFTSVADKLRNDGFSYNEIIAVQISVTFIVISVVTAFSQKSDVVYWQDAMYYKLERPVISNFCALSSYLFVDLLFSIFLVIFSNDFVYISFFISILILILLSYRMIEAFFMHDYIKIQLENEYMDAKIHRRDNRRKRDLYRDYKRKTIQNTLTAVETNEIETVCENMSFLYKYNETDDTEYLVRYMIENNRIFMLSSVVKDARFIFSEEDKVKYYFELCKELLDITKNNSKFVKSMIRSIGEYIVYEMDNNDESLKKYETTLNSFCEYLKKLNLSDIAEEINNNYQKQIDGYYAKK